MAGEPEFHRLRQLPAKSHGPVTMRMCNASTTTPAGLGAGVRGPLVEEQKAKGYTFRNVPCQFGGEVQGADVSFIRGTHPKTNKQYFFNWAAQAGWAIRLRAENTQRLVNAEQKKAKGEPYETIRPAQVLVHQPRDSQAGGCTG